MHQLSVQQLHVSATASLGCSGMAVFLKLLVLRGEISQMNWVGLMAAIMLHLLYT